MLSNGRVDPILSYLDRSSLASLNVTVDSTISPDTAGMADPLNIGRINQHRPVDRVTDLAADRHNYRPTAQIAPSRFQSVYSSFPLTIHFWHVITLFTVTSLIGRPGRLRLSPYLILKFTI